MRKSKNILKIIENNENLSESIENHKKIMKSNRIYRKSLKTYKKTIDSDRFTAFPMIFYRFLLILMIFL